MKIHEDAEGGIYVVGVTTRLVHSLQDVSFVLAYLMKKYNLIQDFGQGQKYCSDPDVLTLLF